MKTNNYEPTGRYTQKLHLRFLQKVIFTRNVFTTDNQSFTELVPTGANVLCFVDSRLLETNPDITDKIKKYFITHKYNGLSETVFAVPGGEEIKNNTVHLKQMIKIIQNSGMCRHSYIIAIGGGAVLDTVGFVCSIVHRGIRHIRIPSTVLSQNDSGMGVKNGINYLGHKNFLGAFTPPEGVIVDFNFLNTLPDRYYRAGISEAFKVAILKDRTFLEWLTGNADKAARRSQSDMEQLVHRCALLHLNHIESTGDPFEKTSLRPLDFGHWSAHHLEEATLNNLNHGEAVSIGICLDLQISTLLDLIYEYEAEKIITALYKCGLPVWHNALRLKKNNKLLLMSALKSFQQHIGGKLTLVMPNGIGNQTEINSLSEDTLASALDKLEILAGKIGET